MVRAYRTSSGARIAINLRGNPEYSVSQSADGFLFVDIVIPESMRQEQESARQAAVSVSPEGPEEGISNAYQSEILIGEQGRTTNPQAVFGTGGGSANPAAQLGMSAGFMFDQTSSSNSQFTGRPISIDLVNADIHHIFRLSDLFQISILWQATMYLERFQSLSKRCHGIRQWQPSFKPKVLALSGLETSSVLLPSKRLKRSNKALETKRSQEELKENNSRHSTQLRSGQ